MKTLKFLIVTFLSAIVLTTVAFASVTVRGTGKSKGEAYADAMSMAPSGSWVVDYVNYSQSLNKWTCTITWKEKSRR